MYDYEGFRQIKKEAGQYGIKIALADMLVLAEQNDPFNCGMPAQIRDAEWFAEMYEKVGGRHLRRIHYRICDLPESERKLPLTLTTKVKPKDGSEPFTKVFEYYENWDRCWEWLTAASKFARYLNLVPISDFVDNRAKEDSFSLYARWLKPGDFEYKDPTPGYEVIESDWRQWPFDLPDLPTLDYLPGLDDYPTLQAIGYTSIQQPYHIEIWIEKSEGEQDVFDPLCRKYKVNFVPGVGNMSLTNTYKLIQRIRDAGRPAKILYVSDFDPSGNGMPVDVARKLEFLVRHHGYSDLDITLEPIMLTKEQVEKYNLPTAPVKESDLRKDSWEAEHGGAVELNAMFARDDRIGEARAIVENAILKYYDTKLIENARAQKSALQDYLNDRQTKILETHQDDIDDLESDYNDLESDWDDLRQEFANLIKPFQEKIDSYQEQVDDLNERFDKLYSLVLEDLRAVEFDPESEYPLPETIEAETDSLLFHSKRGYWGQLRRYKEYQLNGQLDDLEWLDILESSEKDE